MVVIQQRWRLQSRMLSALRTGDEASLHALLNLGLDADTAFKLGGWSRPAVCLAVERGYSKLVDLLCSRNCSTSSQDREEMSPLHLAAIYGYIEVAAILLDNRADVNYRKAGHGDTALHIAAANKKVDMVSFLLSRGAKVDVLNSDGKTPLMHAAANGDLEAARLLMEAGANPLLQDKGGNTALLLHSASAWLSKEMTELLSVSDRAVNLCNSNGSYPILEVVKSTSSEKQEALKVLIKEGAELDVVNRLGSSPLHLVCSNSDWSSARILVRGGARLDIQDSLGRSPMFIVLKTENFLLAASMMAAGCSTQLSVEQHGQLSAAAKLFVKEQRRVGSLKYSARRVMRRVWGRRVATELDQTDIPVQLKHYVYYLLEY